MCLAEKQMYCDYVQLHSKTTNIFCRKANVVQRLTNAQ